jgi:hypothetical protein
MSLEHHALFVIGTEDNHYDRAMLSEIEEATGGESLVFEDADHRLELPGKPLESSQFLKDFVTRLESLTESH